MSPAASVYAGSTITDFFRPYRPIDPNLGDGGLSSYARYTRIKHNNTLYSLHPASIVQIYGDVNKIHRVKRVFVVSHMDCSPSLIVDPQLTVHQADRSHPGHTIGVQQTHASLSTKLHAAPTDAEAIQLAQLLSSRICHDLIGSIGIAAATDDLRDADDRIDEEALALVAESARAAAARLAFFRFAFGYGQNGNGVVASTSLLSLARGALASSRLRIEWIQGDAAKSAPEQSLPVPEARLLLCLMLIATEALPRGGTVSIKVSRAQGWFKTRIRATGTGARLPQSSLDAYSVGSCVDLTPRTVVGFYAGRLSAQLQAQLGWASEPGERVDVTLRVPFGDKREQGRHRVCA